MARDDDPPGCEVETTVPLVGRGVTEEDTGYGARSKLVFDSGSHVGRLAIEQLIGNAAANSGGGALVEEVGRRGEGLDPVFGRHASMNEQGVNSIVEGPKNVLGFAILLGGVWARET